jgi:hypothetical protein
VGVDDAEDLTDATTDPLASDLVVACEAVWRSIQSHHPELPPVVMLLGTGVERGRLVKLGHWWGGRWLADGDVRGEVLLAGEALHLKPEDVFEVLLHEAAHGINAARGVKDTSRGGRYHNARFKTTAVEVGLDVEQMDPYGFAKTSVRSDTAERYSAEIEHLATAMRIARRIPSTALTNGDLGPQRGDGQPNGSGPDDGTRRQQVKPAECGCGRRMRMAPSVLAQGPVTCGNCGSDFVVDRGVERSGSRPFIFEGEEPSPNGAVTSDSLQRAERLLAAEASAADGLDVVLRLGRWRAGFDTEVERPIPIANEGDRDRWTRLARAVLTIDGLLDGDGLELADGMEVRSGDRLIVDRSTGGDLPEVGTPGVVTDVRQRDGLAMVDFATAGVYAIRPGSPAASALVYDYCAIEPLAPAASTSAGIGPNAAHTEVELDLGVDL